MEINYILTERGKRYGEFSGVSLVAQNIKSAMRHSDNWSKLPADAREGLEMVANKLGRILNGDPLYVDSWRDAEGYFKLVADRLAAIACERTGDSVSEDFQPGIGN